MKFLGRIRQQDHCAILIMGMDVLSNMILETTKMTLNLFLKV